MENVHLSIGFSIHNIPCWHQLYTEQLIGPMGIVAFRAPLLMVILGIGIEYTIMTLFRPNCNGVTDSTRCRCFFAVHPLPGRIITGLYISGEWSDKKNYGHSLNSTGYNIRY